MKKKSIPMWAAIIIDVLGIGAGLVVFALFHHVLPRAYSVDLSAVQPPAVVSQSDQAVSESDVPTLKFADKYTEDVVITPSSYTSEEVSVTLTERTVPLTDVDGGYTANCYILDIYLEDVSNLRTAFAKDQFGRGIYEDIMVTSERHNAICAINGDFYSCRSAGVVIRNGFEYRNNPNADVCVITNDGVMKTYTEKEFEANPALTNNVWQAWCFGPSLLDAEGKAYTRFDSSVAGTNPRTAIGYYEPGHYCFVTVDGRSTKSYGLSLTDLAKLFEDLGCTAAYNLDGGQSAIMVLNGEVINEPCGDGKLRLLGDIIYIYDPNGGNE